MIQLAWSTCEVLNVHLAQLQGDILFPDTRGNRLRQSHLTRNRSGPLVIEAGLPRIRFRDLRHTYASYWPHKSILRSLVAGWVTRTSKRRLSVTCT